MGQGRGWAATSLMPEHASLAACLTRAPSFLLCVWVNDLGGGEWGPYC